MSKRLSRQITTRILRRLALVVLAWLRDRVEPEVSKQVDERLEQAKRLDATNKATKKELVRLEAEFNQLQARRDELHSDLALAEFEIEQQQQKVNL